MQKVRHLTYRCAAVAAAVSLSAAAAAPQDEPPPKMSTIGGERLARPGVQLEPKAGAPGLPGS